MTTYTGTVNAFITNSWTTLDTVAKSDDPVSELTYYPSDMKGVPDWVKVGTAEITVTLMDEKVITQGMVDSIDKQITQTYAEAESKINTLKQRKQELLAITMDAS